MIQSVWVYSSILRDYCLLKAVPVGAGAVFHSYIYILFLPLKNNINPLEYIDELPNYFAAELDIKKIIIPNGFINIPEGAFSDCSKLESIYIPKSVIDIGWAAFAGCNNLKDVYYEGTQEEWERIYIEESYLDEGDDNAALLNANIHYNI